MRNWRFIAATLLAALVVNSCGGGGTDPTPTPPPVGNATWDQAIWDQATWR